MEAVAVMEVDPPSHDDLSDLTLSELLPLDPLLSDLGPDESFSSTSSPFSLIHEEEYIPTSFPMSLLPEDSLVSSSSPSCQATLLSSSSLCSSSSNCQDSLLSSSSPCSSSFQDSLLSSSSPCSSSCQDSLLSSSSPCSSSCEDSLLSSSSPYSSSLAHQQSGDLRLRVHQTTGRWLSANRSGACQSIVLMPRLSWPGRPQMSP